MGTMYYKTFCLWWNLLMLLVTLNTISQGLVESSQSLDKTKFGPAPKGTIKTIEVPEDGDMIDCVDFYKQPAFKDPLIKKDFQMIPSKTYESLFNGTNNSQSNIFQNWNRYGECPKGSIPIRRTWNKYNRSIHRKTINVDDTYKHEYAIARQHGSIYNGAAATFTLWNPRVSGPNEFSLTQLWVGSDRTPPINVIECGWIVCPLRYHDLQTRLFSYWTSDEYNRTGCYDLDCAGFVQTNHRWALGGVLNHVSEFGKQQVEMRISFSRDHETGRWYLEVQGTKIGYFPSSKFPTLRYGADLVDFGGEITNDMPENKHTSTHMGSGEFPGAGYKKASYVRNIEVISQKFETQDASLEKDITRAECYDLSFGPPETPWRTHFFYGGPGFSDKCFTP